MSTVPLIVEQPPVAEDPAARTSAYRHWPVVACYLLGALTYLWSGRGRVPRPSATLFRAALTYWRPAAILAVTSETSRLGRFLIRLLRRPAFRVGRVVAWRR